MKKMAISGKNVVEGLVIAAAIIMAQSFGILVKDSLIGNIITVCVLVGIIIYIVVKTQKK